GDGDGAAAGGVEGGVGHGHCPGARRLASFMIRARSAARCLACSRSASRRALASGGGGGGATRPTGGCAGTGSTFATGGAGSPSSASAEPAAALGWPDGVVAGISTRAGSGGGGGASAAS